MGMASQGSLPTTKRRGFELELGSGCFERCQRLSDRGLGLAAIQPGSAPLAGFEILQPTLVPEREHSSPPRANALGHDRRGAQPRVTPLHAPYPARRSIRGMLFQKRNDVAGAFESHFAGDRLAASHEPARSHEQRSRTHRRHAHPGFRYHVGTSITSGPA